MTEKDSREIAIQYLKAGDFGPNERCCMKFREGKRHTKFGAVIQGDPLTICLIDRKGRFTGEIEEFVSIEAMLDAGWDVD